MRGALWSKPKKAGSWARGREGNRLAPKDGFGKFQTFDELKAMSIDVYVSMTPAHAQTCPPH